MRKIAILIMFGLVSLLSSLDVTPAIAQTRTWVSGVGDDANPCSRTAPCKTFAGAISKTAAGGEINVLDPGGFGAVTITKAITISSENFEAGVLVSGTNGIVISAGASDVVILRGLDIQGLGTGLSGISFLQGGALHVENCVIRGFQGGAATGINFTPNGQSKLFVDNTIISENGVGVTGGGIIIKPTGSGSAAAYLTKVRSENNVLGIRADGTGSSGGINVSIADSAATGNTFGGITSFTPAGGAATTVIIMKTTVANNGTGLNANGVGATLRIGSSIVAGNSTGDAIQNGATMTSYGNNQINNNTIGGAAIPIVGPE